MKYNYLYAIFKLFNHCFDQSTLKFFFRRNLDTLHTASHRKHLIKLRSIHAARDVGLSVTCLAHCMK